MNSVELAIQTVEQLITISSAIIGISFAFSEGKRSIPNLYRRALQWSLVLHFFCILSGVFIFMKITGQSAVSEGELDIDIFSGSVSYPATMQVLFFVSGMATMLYSMLFAPAPEQPRD